MDSPSVTNIGVVSNIRIIHLNMEPPLFLLEIHTEQGKPMRLPISEGVARGLWAQLTHMLYPRAAEKLTGTAETALAFKGKNPYVAHLLNASIDKKNKDHIAVYGMGEKVGWSLSFSRKEGEEIWAELENIFRNVGKR